MVGGVEMNNQQIIDQVPYALWSLIIVGVLGLIYFVSIFPSQNLHHVENRFCSNHEDGLHTWSMCDYDILPWGITTCSTNFTIDTNCKNNKAIWRWTE